jgi:hypothetical protein
MAANGEVVGRYYTAGGALGAEVTRWRDASGAVNFSYVGRWGTGASRSADVVLRWLKTAIGPKRDVIVEIDFADCVSGRQRVAA